MEWKLVSGNQVKARVSSAETDSPELLGDLLAMWSRDRDLHDWDDKDRMARVAVDHTDLDRVEIWAIFEVDPNDLPECGDPPWTFSHPSRDDEITLRSEE